MERHFRDYGEFTTGHSHWTDTTRKNKLNFLDVYQDFVNGSNAITYVCEPDVETLRPYIRTDFPS